MRRRVLLGRREALQHLELADAEPVLVLQRVLQRARDARVALEQLAPLVDRSASREAGDIARRIIPSCRIICVHIICTCISCRCMYIYPHAFHHQRFLHRSTLALGCLVLLRRPLPRWSRRLDGGHRASFDPGRPGPHHLPAAVGRQSATCSATAGCCCSAAARLTCSGGGACCSWALGVFTVASAAGRPRLRRHAARDHALHQGRQRRVHRARRPVASSRRRSPRARSATGRSASTPPPARAASRSGSCSAAR